jgi:hypothetical protein
MRESLADSANGQKSDEAQRRLVVKGKKAVLRRHTRCSEIAAALDGIGTGRPRLDCITGSPIGSGRRGQVIARRRRSRGCSTDKRGRIHRSINAHGRISAY